MDTWVLWNLTGEHLTDVTNASRTLLMNLETLDWNEEHCDLLGIPTSMLPEIRSSSEQYGEYEGVPICGILGAQHAALFGQTAFDAGDDARATEWLERVVAHFASRQHTDLPPEGTLRLARLYEKRPDGAARALDLYSILAQGSDQPNLPLYHLEAARLMKGLDLKVEARRMLQRARELAPSDAEVQTGISEALRDLESQSSA